MRHMITAYMARNYVWA